MRHLPRTAVFVEWSPPKATIRIMCGQCVCVWSGAYLRLQYELYVHSSVCGIEPTYSYNVNYVCIAVCVEWSPPTATVWIMCAAHRSSGVRRVSESQDLDSRCWTLVLHCPHFPYSFVLPFQNKEVLNFLKSSPQFRDFGILQGHRVFKDCRTSES